MALPASPYLPAHYTPIRSASLFSTAMSSGGGGAVPMSYQARAAALLAGARAFSSGGGGASTGMSRHSDAGAMRSAAEFGGGEHGVIERGKGMLKDGGSLFGTGAAFAVMDKSEYGKSFHKFTHDTMQASTATFFVGLAARVLNADRSMPSVRRANNMMLRTMFPVLGYRIGERLIEGSLFNMPKLTKSTPKAPPPPAKAGVGGVETPIPGERTST
jgi:hypothetical protein